MCRGRFQVLLKLLILQREALAWNKLHFGNIFTRKRKIMARLNGIQRAVVVRPSNSLLDLENNLLKELDVVLG